MGNKFESVYVMNWVLKVILKIFELLLWKWDNIF